MKPQVNFEEQAPQIMAPPPKPRKTVDDNGAPYIEIVTGGRFYYNEPEWDIGAIAHALSLQCRFTGQCSKFYSVAEHSILVSRIMEDLGLGDPMEGLLHDSVESVLSDIARPAKQLLKDYKALDKALDGSMRKTFGLPPTMSEGCMHADAVAVLLEAKTLMPSKGVGPCWVIDTPLMKSEQLNAQVAKMTYAINGWTPENAKSRFMQRMTDIRRRLRGLR